MMRKQSGTQGNKEMPIIDKHTPGPWRYSHQDPWDNRAVILNAPKMPDGQSAQLLREIASVVMGHSDGKSEGNMKLIASAPKLLAENRILKQFISDIKKFIVKQADSPATLSTGLILLFQQFKRDSL